MASLCIFREVRRGLEFRSNQGSFLTAGFIKNNYIWTCNLKISQFISGCVRPWGIAEKDLHFLEINVSADVQVFVMPNAWQTNQQEIFPVDVSLSCFSSS